MFFNAELVKQGYAQAATFPPNVKYVKLFISLQKEARENNRGLWKETVQKVIYPCPPIPGSEPRTTSIIS
jgi:endonuclease YncB( thermonuclease family)